MAHMIEVRNLVKRFGDHVAVNDISFDVDEGRIYGFLGPNGAGKSTTMNIVTGYIGATSGEVLVDGHSITSEPEAAKKAIGYLPEIPPLYVDMTVNEYLRFSAGLKGIPSAQVKENVDKVVEMVGLTEVRGRLIKNLSKGYKQRVGLGHALMGFPKVLILDEPTVGLDPKQIIEIRTIIKELAKEHTIIFSSHILQEVSAVADHIIIIAHGNLVASDTPENLERQLSGDNTIELTVRGNAADIEAVLGAAEGVDSFEKRDERGGVCDYEIRMDLDNDPRERLFYALAEKKLPIISMALKYSSLGEMFLALTQDKPEPQTAADENEGGEENDADL